jgi:uncharacterized protein (DUF58 family)
MVKLQREFWTLPVFSAVSLGFAGWLDNSVLWSLFYTSLGLIALVLLFRWRNWRRVSMTRTIYTRQKFLEAGCRIRVTIAAKSSSLIPYPWLDLRDSLPPALARNRTSLAGGRVIWLDQRQEREIIYYLEDVPRGVHCLEAIEVRAGDPLGMTTFSDRFRSPSQFVVYPKIVNLNAWRFFPRRVDGTASAKNTLNHDLSQLVGVRQYNPGDRLSLIHWKSSAKTGELHSKEFAPLLTDSSLVVLDCSASAWETGYDPAFEEAVRAATSLVRAAWLQRIPVRFFSNWGKEPGDLNVSNQEDYTRFLLHMANIAPLGRQSLSQSIYTDLLTQGINVVVITPVVGGKLQRVLFRLAARGNTVTVINIGQDPVKTKPARPAYGSFSTLTINKAEDLVIPSPRKEATP